MPKRVGVIGSGPVGQKLASAFSSTGYETRISSRTPDKLREFIAQNKGKISSGTFDQVSVFGEILVLATHGEATENACDIAGAKNFSRKIVIDASNPLDFSKGMPPGIVPKYAEKSLGETIQAKLPDAMVVKCFNTVPNEIMFRPIFEESRMLICGNDSNAKNEVTKILKEFGWAGSIDVGRIENSRWLEALVPLWVRASVASNNFTSMFKFVTAGEDSRIRR